MSSRLALFTYNIISDLDNLSSGMEVAVGVFAAASERGLLSLDMSGFWPHARERPPHRSSDLGREK